MTDLDFSKPLTAENFTVAWAEMIDHIVALMGCSTGTIHRFDSDTELLTLVAQKGIPEELIPKLRSIPIGKGIAGAAAQSRGAVQLCNLQTDTSGVAEPEAKKTQVSGALAVPIMDDDDKLCGTLGVGMHEPHEFTEREIEHLWLISAILPMVVRALGI